MDKISNPQFELKVKSRGEQIFKSLTESEQSIFNKDWWYGKIMDWSMRDKDFKTQMFRFVDVLPYLNDSEEVARHLKEYFKDTEGGMANLFNVGLGMGRLAPGLMASTVRKNVTQMARMFITGESPLDAIPKLESARGKNICFTVDLLGEATLSEMEALEYQSRYIELIDELSNRALSWKDVPIMDSDDQGPIPKVNVSVKLSSLYSQINERAWEETKRAVKERVRPIFSMAKQRGVFVNIDMESYHHKDLTLEIFKEIIVEDEFKDYPHFGIVIQAYLRDSFEDSKDLIQFAKKRKTPISVRLVKGAYWDYECIHANQQGWPIPVYTNKKESDWNYERCALEFLKAHPVVKLAAGSHNVRSLSAVVEMAEDLKLPKNAVEMQMLFGMADPIKVAMLNQGYRVREYATIGELIPGMAYLVRRLLENTSNESFLRSKFADNTSTEVLLQNPSAEMKTSEPYFPKKDGVFYNEPILDYVLKENRENTEKALIKFHKNIGKNYPIVIGGKELKGSTQFERKNPSNPNEVLGKIEMASIEQADQALQEAKQAFPKWSQTPVPDRVGCLRKLAELFRRERFQLMAIQIYECGKPWSEADGDIAEAIDFVEFYADEMEKLAPGQQVSFVMGESSLYHHIPRGVSLVIAPWNFPLAILTGMTVANLVTGNTVIMKPAEQSSMTASALMKLLLEAGIPKDVVSFLPGFGEEVGAHLVRHPDVNLISFTGSRAVGMNILKETVNPMKQAIVEMGGKNALIIDSDADLDEAVAGVVYSAFGFAGQKCSACSRVIVLDEIYDRFKARLKEATTSLHVRPAQDPHAFLGPVVDHEAYDRIMETIEKNKKQHQLLCQAEVPANGYFVPPTIFENVDPQSELAQEEVFGPVLAMIRVKDLEEALKVANGTEYALTGGVFSRSPENIEKVRNGFQCGNLYINRGITGALVGRHPFGGYKMSGLGSKTGGPEYLQQHMVPRVATENTMRRGFAPDLEI